MDFDIDSVTAGIKAKFKKRAWLIGLGVLILAPVAAWLLTAMLTIAALGFVCLFVAAAAVVVINVVPAFMDKMANLRINLIVAEATKSPIESIQHGIDDDQKARDEENASAKGYDTRILAIRQQFRALTADLAPADVLEFETSVQEMERDREAWFADIKQMDLALADARKELKRLTAVWELATSITDGQKMRDARKAGEAIRKIRDDAALKAVNDRLAAGRASLRERARNRKDVTVSGNVPSLSNNPTPPMVEIMSEREAAIRIQR